VETTAYFIACEALTNVVKHAGADHAAVRLTTADHELRLEFSDNGRGGADPRRGTGLAGLADRARAIGGELTVRTCPTRHPAANGAAMRVALADDSTLFRRGLATLLRASDVDVTCEARNAVNGRVIWRSLVAINGAVFESTYRSRLARCCIIAGQGLGSGSTRSKVVPNSATNVRHLTRSTTTKCLG